MGPAALAMLPGWIRWGFVAHWIAAFVAAFLLTLLPGGLLLRRAALATPGMHWTEKARRVSPVRLIEAIGHFVYPWLLGAIAYGWCSSMSLVQPKFDALGAMLMAFVAASIASILIRRRIRRVHDFPPATGAKTVLRWYAILLPLVGSYGLVLFGQPAGSRAALLVDAFAIAWLILTTIKSTVVFRLFGLTRPAGARVKRAVETAAHRMGCSPPKTFEADLQMANAFATPFEGAVGFTTGALHVLNDDEMAAVACHEMAHLLEDRPSRWMRLVTPLAILIFLACAARGIELQAILLGIVIVSLIASSTNRAKRALEKRADLAGRKHEPDPQVYATALLRLYEANLTPAATKEGGSHPMLYDRLVAAGLTPTFPRPQAPAYCEAWLCIVLTTALLGMGAYYRDELAWPSPWRLALFGGSQAALEAWADAARSAGNVNAELDFWEASVKGDRSRRVAVVNSLVARGECGRALRLADPMRDEAASTIERETLSRAESSCERSASP